MSEQKIEIVEGEIATLSLKPADRVVLMYPTQLSADYREELIERFQRWAPGIQCLVMEGGARLAVLRSDPELSVDSE